MMENKINGFLLLSMGFIQRTGCIMSDFKSCHSDFTVDPPDGLLPHYTFSWLGIVYYIHVARGYTHHKEAPRVVLIQKQFALGSAADLLNIPEEFKLGNVVFGDYEQDEEECGLTMEDLREGKSCPRAYLEMPILEILPNPEYSSFGVGDSVALVKLMVPLKSSYVVPICLPGINERAKMKLNPVVHLIDYISQIPKDFKSERMAKKTLTLAINRNCNQSSRVKKAAPEWSKKLGTDVLTHVLCTSGCGIRSGAPIIRRSVLGRFELVGLATGGPGCLNSDMRDQFYVAEPPLFVDVFPYVSWIVNMITAHLIPKPYPQNFNTIDGRKDMGYRRKKDGCRWMAHIYRCGDCKGTTFFYMDTFTIDYIPREDKFKFKLEVSAGIETTIICARLRLHYKINTLKLTGLGHYKVVVEFPKTQIPPNFFMSVALYGKTTSYEDYVKWLPDRKG